jgi:hypothetical protein
LSQGGVSRYRRSRLLTHPTLKADEMKILRIDVGAAGGPKVSEEPLGAYEGLGGRALTSAIVAKEVDPLCHPLGPENKLEALKKRLL